VTPKNITGNGADIDYNIFQCNHCGRTIINPASISRCPYCNSGNLLSIGESGFVPPQKVECPCCGEMVDYPMNNCPNCSQRLVVSRRELDEWRLQLYMLHFIHL
jgi:hypothetical protein